LAVADLQADPYSPPPDWLEGVQLIAECADPRVIVSVSLGRAAYRPVIDVRPTVVRLDAGDGAGERVSFEAPSIAPGDNVDFATALYGQTCSHFLDARRGDGAGPVRVAKVRLQVFDAATCRACLSHQLSREAFAEDEAGGLYSKEVGMGERIVSQSLAALADHAKNVGAQFVALSKQCNEQAAKDREGVPEYVRAAMAIAHEASELRAGALAELAEQRSGGGVWDTDAGQMVLTELAANIGELSKLGRAWLGMRTMGKAAAGKAAAASSAS
jgi:hypothetical protein